MKNLRTYGSVYFLILLVAAAGVIWYAVFTLEGSHHLRLIVFDIGQGDSIFIQAENDTQVLIDGGPSNAVLAKLGSVMPFWDRSIDLVVLTHPHADHMAGLIEVLKRYDIGMVLESGADYSTAEYREWHALLEQKHIPIAVARAGQKIHLSPKTELDILTPFESFIGKSPSNVHDAMVVSKLIYASSSALLTGDAEKYLEYRLLLSGVDLKSDILKVGHHGSKTSTVPDFVAAVAPEYAVISAGRKNRYGHPTQQTLDTLAKFNIKTFRTDQNRDVEFTSDGSKFERVLK
ncbi:MAG: MBL fold metallo-hydrolase [Candidatus Sungbacteria bacterium]|nr:MBL fold metallo-hydrolase [Candidatus Sungbacteria bacterium]